MDSKQASKAQLTLIVDKNTEAYQDSYYSLMIEISGNGSDYVAKKLCTYGNISSFASFHVNRCLYTEATVRVMPKGLATVPIAKLEGFLAYFCTYPCFDHVVLMPNKNYPD